MRIEIVQAKNAKIERWHAARRIQSKIADRINRNVSAGGQEDAALRRAYEVARGRADHLYAMSGGYDVHMERG